MRQALISHHHSCTHLTIHSTQQDAATSVLRLHIQLMDVLLQYSDAGDGTAVAGDQLLSA